MTRQDIETAVNWNAGVWTSREGTTHLATFQRVALAWLALEDYFRIRSYPPAMLDKMHELLNPAPKSDLERVREAIFAEMRVSGSCHIEDVFNILSRIEAEKKEQL